jgi:hypothetical protein
MSMILITEAKNFDIQPVETIIEKFKQDDGSYQKSYYINGPFIQCEAKNRNGRKYGKQLMESVVQKYKQERMNPSTGLRSMGELGHPEGVEINLDRVSHYIINLDWQGNDCIGKAKVLISHPCGKMLQTFLDDKLRIGVSTRGLGSLSDNQNPDGSKQVESYEMIAVDAVADPSAPEGFVEGILENKEYIIGDNGTILECVNKLQRKVNILPKHSIDRKELFAEALTNFISSLKSL